MNNLSLDFKIKNNKSKIMLRDILNDYLPKDIINRPKKALQFHFKNGPEPHLKKKSRYWSKI